ncbi:MAG: aminoglycoside phosphotransferase family protein, partial [Actinomycetota bacterium]|nr:aminoglycoside phosphotransferase family protein [Actinomycetota bacterium]
YRRLEVAAWPMVPLLADAADELLADLTGSHGPAPGHVATDPLDLDEMTGVLRVALAETASRPRELRVEAAVEVASATGRRSVVRYAVRGLDGAHASPVIGKVFTEPRRARLLHEHLRLLSAGPFRYEPACVPEPLGLLPERALVLYRSCAGAPLDQITDLAEAARGAALAARWLARLHGSDIVLPRRLLLHQEAISTCEWARLVGQVHPPVAARARRLAEGWLVAGLSPGFEGNRPIHKDFHAGHVLVGPGVCVIDLDEARQGDPTFDVAHFSTYLELEASTDPSRSALRRVFLDEYAAAGAKVDEDALGPYCVYTWLKIAKQWVSGSGPGRTASPAQRRDGVMQAIAKGEAWLSG